MACCRECTHGKPALNDEDISCQRYPPVPLMVFVEGTDQGEVLSFWPTVRGNESCGEYREQ
jgi:hypothetical protein